MYANLDQLTVIMSTPDDQLDSLDFRMLDLHDDFVPEYDAECYATEPEQQFSASERGFLPCGHMFMDCTCPDGDLGIHRICICDPDARGCECDAGPAVDLFGDVIVDGCCIACGQHIEMCCCNGRIPTADDAARCLTRLERIHPKPEWQPQLGPWCDLKVVPGVCICHMSCDLPF